jgi:hypothetical protein
MLFVSTEISEHGLLYDYSNIKAMTITYKNPVQMIVAANGAGKTTLIENITTLALDKDQYRKNGYIEHLVEHNGRIYRLRFVPHSKTPYQIFDLSEPGDPDFNINESGNVGSYVELVNAIFGYNNQIDKLMRLRYPITDMTKAQRKEFISTFNPYNVQLIELHYKKVASTLRSLKNQVKLLLNRKVTLENQRLDERQLNELQQCHTKRQQELKHLEEQLIICKNHINTLDISMRDLQSEDTSGITLAPDPLKSISIQYSEIRDQIHRIYSHSDQLIYNESAVLQQMQQQLENQLKQMVEDMKGHQGVCDRYSGYINLNVQEELNTRRTKIQQLDQHITELAPRVFRYGASEYSRITDQLIELSDHVNRIHHCLPLFPPAVLDKLQRHTQQLQYTNKRLQDRCDQLEREIEESNKFIKTKLESMIPDDCSRSNCKVRGIYLDKQATIGAKLAKDTKEHLELQSKLERRYRAQERLVTRLQSREYSKEYERLWLQLPEDIRLWITESDPFLMINRSYSSLTVRINNLIALVKEHIQRDDLETAKKQLVFEVEKLEASDIPVQSLVAELVESTQAKLETLRTAHERLYDQWSKHNRTLTQRRQYEQCRLKLESLAQGAELAGQIFIYNEHHKLYSHIFKYFQRRIESLQKQLEDDLLVLRQQEKVNTILEEEINPVLTKLETDVRDYTLMEKELGPNGCSHRYTVTFINSIIETANAILRNTWNYELQLIPLNIDAELTFEIQRLVKGRTAKDISRCSRSQKDIINIAFSLGIILHKELQYGKIYPLYMDECDEHMDHAHRERLIGLINELIRSGNIKQLLNINHHIALSTGVVGADVICLSDEYITVPEAANEYVKIRSI